MVFNYLGQADNIVHHHDNSWITKASEDTGNSVDEGFSSGSFLDINSIVSASKLYLNWSYSARHFEASTIQALAQSYLDHLKAIIDHCLMQKEQKLAPSDYGLAPEVPYEDFHAFFANSPDGIRADNISGLYRLSPLQQGILFYHLYDSSSRAYVEQFQIDFPEGVDIEALLNAFDYIIKRHSILRSCIISDHFSIPVQCINKEVEIPFQIVDFQDLSPEEQEQQVDLFLNDDIDKGIDLNTPPLMRLTVLQLAEGVVKLVWTTHHILIDGWSMSVLFAEVLEVYEKYSKGLIPAIKLSDNYEDYIQYIAGKDKYEEERFWKNYVKDATGPSLLPFVNSSQDHNKGAGVDKETLVMDRAQTLKIRRFASQHQLTVNTVLQGVWAYLLSKYTNQSEVTYGVTVSGRPSDLANAGQRVGLYINTIPLIAEITPTLGIASWLQDIQRSHTEAREYQYTPLNKIQHWAGVANEFFDSILVFENYPISEVIAEKKETLKLGEVTVVEQSNYLLNISVGLHEEIHMAFQYNGELIASYFINKIKEQFNHVLLQIIDETNALLEDLSISTPEEVALLEQANATFEGYPATETLIELFAQQVNKTPNAPALMSDELQLTYQELNEQTDKLARYLIENHAIGKGDFVGIMMRPSIWSVISLLGVMKSGAAYVPIEVDYPKERQQFILEDAALKALLIESDSLFDVMDLAVSIISVDIQLDDYVPESELGSDLLNADDSAYVIYTSGSTGQPKGVEVSHF